MGIFYGPLVLDESWVVLANQRSGERWEREPLATVVSEGLAICSEGTPYIDSEKKKI